MAMRTDAQPLAFGHAASFAHHVCRHPSLVDEDEPLDVEIELAAKPFLASLHNVGSVLLVRMGGLSLSVRP